MNDNTLISVIVPVYNVETYLNRCVDSILNQTYKHLQIILIDDGSTDNSGHICDEYSLEDSRVKVIHQNNSGPVKARKIGLEISTGEYVGFIDSDDWIEPNMYEEMLTNILQTNADFINASIFIENGEVSIVKYFYGENIIDNPKNSLIVWESLMGTSKNSYINRGFVTKLFKRDLIVDCLNNLPNDIYLGEDYITTALCFIKCNRVSFLNKCYYHYVLRKGSLVNVRDTSRMIRVAKLYDQLKKIFIQNNLYEKLRHDLDKMFIKDMIYTIKHTGIYDFIMFKLNLNEKLLNKKIVIYGAGDVGYDYCRQLLMNSSCQVVDWVDKNFKKYNYKEREVHSINNLKNLEYDLVLIAVKRQKMAEQIMNELILMGIDRDKLYWSKPIQLIPSV